MDEATARYGIMPGQRTPHQDCGSPMTARGYRDLMRELDVTCSYSRPLVSNDNAFSEKANSRRKSSSSPIYPSRLGDVAHARSWCEGYFDWYNLEHHHKLGRVYTGRNQDVAKQKLRALDERYQQNPERFVRGQATAPFPPKTVAINLVALNDDDVAVDG